VKFSGLIWQRDVRKFTMEIAPKGDK